MIQRTRLAILECDVPIDPVQSKYGSYGNCFEALINRSIQSSERSPELDNLITTKWDVVNAQIYPDPEHIDAVLITGSRYNAYEDDPWIVKLVNTVRSWINTKRIRIIGVCFGHQIVGRAMGAPVSVNEDGWEVSVSNIELSKEGKALFGLPRLAMHQMHRDIVKSVPFPAINLGSSPACTVQGLYVPGQILTLQSHPEFNEFITSQILEFRHHQKIIGTDLFTDAMRRVDKSHDGLVVGRVFVDFLIR